MFPHFGSIPTLILRNFRFIALRCEFWQLTKLSV